MLEFRCPQCHQLLASSQIKNGRQFCSRYCKNENQKKRITLTCKGCHKVFSILPYLKRQTNYCSIKCYHNSTRVKEKRLCRVCRKEFYATGPLVKKGFGIYCGRKCQHSVYEQKRVTIACRQCGQIRHLPPSIAIQRHSTFCSKKCKDDHSRDYVERVCKNCHRSFQIPTWETKKGKGSFCSRFCFIKYRGESTIEKRVRYALQRSKTKFSQEVKIGTYRADFLLPEFNLIIECDGEYWHDRKPGVPERDQRKTVFLQNQGYKVVRLPEQTIRKTPIAKLQAFLHQQVLSRKIELQPQILLS